MGARLHEMTVRLPVPGGTTETTVGDVVDMIESLVPWDDRSNAQHALVVLVDRLRSGDLVED